MTLIKKRQCGSKGERASNSYGASSSSYVPGIDGLRAIAVLSVVLYHFSHAILPGGFAGVDVFFVISGYVISKSLATSKSTNVLDFVLGFYKRRILRIVPALLVCLVVTSIASNLFIPDSWLSELNNRTAVWAFFGVSNFYLIHHSDGYFSQRILFNPFIHTWSLAVEEQFYLFFPVIFWVWLRLSNGHIPRRAFALSILPVIALLSLVLASFETSYVHDQAFYLLPSRFWELAAGAMLFQSQAYRAGDFKTPARSELMLFFGAALIAVGLVYAKQDRFPFPWALFPIVGSTLMIAGTTGVTGTSLGIHALIESRPMNYIGRISYSIYLWHWPVFSLFRWTVGLTKPVTAVVALLLTSGLSALSYHSLEKVFRESKSLRNLAGWKIVAIGLLSMAASGCAVAVFLRYSAAFGFNLSVTANKYDWSPDFCRTGCAPVRAVDTVGAGRKIFVIGDSHASAYSSMVTLAAASLGAKATMLSNTGCPIGNLILASKDSHECIDFERYARRWVKEQANPGDIVFLASLRVHRLSDQWGLLNQAEVLARSALPAEVKMRRLALIQATELAELFQSQGLYVLMDAPKPVFRAPAFRCSDWFNRSNPICTPGFTIERDLLIDLREPAMESLKVLHESRGIYVWDPFPVLCAGPVCSVFDGKKPKFEDGDHLSGYGDRLLVPSFTRQLQEIWSREVPSTQQTRGPV